MDPLRFILLVAFLPFLKLSFAAEEFKTAKGKLIITPINHATLVIEWSGKTIYVDPVGVAGWYKAFPKPDLVLLTHVHGDHFREAVLNAVVGPNRRSTDEALASSSSAWARSMVPKRPWLWP